MVKTFSHILLSEAEWWSTPQCTCLCQCLFLSFSSYLQYKWLHMICQSIYLFSKSIHKTPLYVLIKSKHVKSVSYSSSFGLHFSFALLKCFLEQRLVSLPASLLLETNRHRRRLRVQDILKSTTRASAHSYFNLVIYDQFI